MEKDQLVKCVELFSHFMSKETLDSIAKARPFYPCVIKKEILEAWELQRNFQSPLSIVHLPSNQIWKQIDDNTDGMAEVAAILQDPRKREKLGTELPSFYEFMIILDFYRERLFYAYYTICSRFYDMPEGKRNLRMKVAGFDSNEGMAEFQQLVEALKWCVPECFWDEAPGMVGMAVTSSRLNGRPYPEWRSSTNHLERFWEIFDGRFDFLPLAIKCDVKDEWRKIYGPKGGILASADHPGSTEEDSEGNGSSDPLPLRKEHEPVKHNYVRNEWIKFHGPMGNILNSSDRPGSTEDHSEENRSPDPLSSREEQRWIEEIDVASLTKTLTDREREVLQLRDEGLTQTEVAKKLGISQPRVNEILKSIGSKFPFKH